MKETTRATTPSSRSAQARKRAPSSSSSLVSAPAARALLRAALIGAAVLARLRLRCRAREAAAHDLFRQDRSATSTARATSAFLKAVSPPRPTHRPRERIQDPPAGRQTLLPHLLACLTTPREPLSSAAVGRVPLDERRASTHPGHHELHDDVPSSLPRRLGVHSHAGRP